MASTTGLRRSRSHASTPPAPARPAVRDFTRGAASYEVAFDARPAYEFLISLLAGDGAEHDLMPDDHAWLERSRASLSDELRADLGEAFQDEAGGIYEGLTAMLVERRDVRTAADVVAAVEAAGARGVARSIVGPLLPPTTGPALLERALDREPGAMEGLEAALAGEHLCDQVTRLLRDLEPSYERMTRALHAWLVPFSEIEARMARLQDADAASHLDARMAADPGALIEQVTGGLRWLPEPGVRTVLLAPSYFARPFNYVYQGGDWRLFCYPMTDRVLESLDPTTPPQSTVRLYRALGDPSRLRILRLLRDGDLYLTELAAHLEVSKPTAKHHLALLRAAGLVTVTEEGGLTYYSLRRERLEEAGAELLRFLG